MEMTVVPLGVHVTQRFPLKVREVCLHLLKDFGVGQFTRHRFCLGENSPFCRCQTLPLLSFFFMFSEERWVPGIYRFQCEIFPALGLAWPAAPLHGGN